MQRIAVRPARSHLGDDLARLHAIAFLYQPLAVVPVGGQETRVVLDDDEFAIADQAVAAVDHAAVGRGAHRIAAATGDVDALAGRVARRERADELAVRRPAPGHVADHRARTRGDRR